MINVVKKFGLSFFLVVMCAAFLFIPIDVKAKGESVNHEFWVEYCEPSSSGYNGYINIMYQTSTGQRLYTYFWTFQPEGNTEYAINNGMYMAVQVNTNSLIFNPVTTIAGGGHLTLACYDWADDLHILRTQYVDYLNNTAVLGESYSGSPIIGYTYKGNVQISSGSQLFDVPTPTIYWNNSVDAYWLDNELNNIFVKLGNIDTDTSTIITKLESIYNQNVATNQKLDNMTALLEQLVEQSPESQEKVDEFGNKSNEQSNKLNDLNNQANNKNKVDAGSSSGDVDAAIDYDAVASYGSILSVVTGHEKILTMILVVFAIGTISYVLFGKRK